MKRYSILVKVLAVVLTASLVIGVLPISVWAEDINEMRVMKTTEFSPETNVDGMYYTIGYENGRVTTITKFNSAGNKIFGLNLKVESVNQRRFTYSGINYDTDYIILQQYDSNMKKTSYIDNEGNYSYYKYDENGDLASYSTNEDNATNLLTNGTFASGNGWQSLLGNNNLFTSGSAYTEAAFGNLDGKVAYLVGSINTNVRMYQSLSNLAVNEEDEVYTLSGWAKSDSYTAPGSYTHDYAHLNKSFAIAVIDSDGEVIARSDFSPYIRSSWQFTAVSFKVNEPLENVKIAMLLDNQLYNVAFDDIRLVKSTASYCVEEDDEQLTTASIPEKTITVDGTVYRLEQCGCSCAQCCQEHKLTVDEVEVTAYYNCACDDENAVCNCFGCRQERASSTTKDSNGNLLTDKITNGSQVMTNVTNTYTANRNYLATSSDGAGGTVYYNYNADTGLLDSYSTISATENLMNYTYNAVGALEQVSQAVNGLSSGNTMTANYTYSGDRITSMSHSGSVYTFEYNAYGNVTDIKVSGNAESDNKQSIVSYGYDSKQRNNKITYGNGTVISYAYNSDGNITEISYSTGQRYTYNYSSDGILTSAYDYSSMFAAIYSDGEFSELKEFTVSDGQPVLGSTVYTYSVNDDGEKTVTAFGKAFTTHNSNDEYISSSDSVKTNGKITYGLYAIDTESVSDFYGRTNQKSFTYVNGDAVSPSFGIEYIYDDTSTVATNRIKEVKNTVKGVVKSDYTYTYDTSGNIATVSKSGVLFQQYVYDEANQVTVEYNYSEGTATTYQYDGNGNIVSKMPYTNVTSADLSSATAGTAITYTYGDSNWSDKLTAYNGQAITYDASGNPTSYKGATITWNGRLMTSYEKDDERYEYTYNSDGMRTSKKRYSDGELAYVMTYVWDGDVLLANRFFNPESNDSVIISYLYDADGELFGMEYNGNGVFAYTKNLQGDIVGIIPLDNESTADVGIEYDAWGYPHYRKSSSVAGAFLTAIMASLNAVGYRGYFFDMETQLYYLRSRYYDPETGRFINADDTNYLGYDGSPLSLNLFAYCCNNPVGMMDEQGHWYSPIYSQKEESVRNIPVGKHPYYVKDVGCELVAIFNMMFYLNKTDSLKSIISFAENNGMLYIPSGKYGTDPVKIYKYFNRKNVGYIKCGSQEKFFSYILQGYYGIITYFNKNFFKNGIHTFFLYYDSIKKEYVVFNGYDASTSSAKRYKRIADIYKKGGKSFYCGYVCKK